MIRPGVVALIVMALPLWPGAEARAAQSDTKVAPVKEPAWYVNPPKDKENIIVRGKAESGDKQLALDKAVLAARSELALKVDSSWQDFLGTLRKEMPTCSEPLRGSGDVALAGTKIRKQKSTKKGKVYTAFVLVAWPRASLNPALYARAQEDAWWYDRVKGTVAVRGLANKR